jgi:hypothetical protein
LADSELKRGTAVLADSGLKRDFADSELKLGIDRFAGKSEIAEGRSDLRESVIRAICRESAMCGCQRAVRQCGWCCELLVR